MTDSDRDLITNLAESVHEQGKSLYQVHGIVSSVSAKQEALGNTLQQLVHAINTRADASDDRSDIHSTRIDETAAQVAAWKSKMELILGVAGFVGVGGLVSMLAVFFKLFTEGK